MPKYTIAPAAVAASNWGYQLQGNNGNPLDPDRLALEPHDLLVIEPSGYGDNDTRFTPEEVEAIKGDRSAVAAYISIGEASDFRDYWDKDWTKSGKADSKLTDDAPDWLGPVNPDWPESRKVRYWDSEWQNIMFNDEKTGDLDSIVHQGFDAAYLDIVDAYYFWGAEVKKSQREAGDPKNESQAAVLMADFMIEMVDHARETNDDFYLIPQNGAWIVDALKDAKGDQTDRIAAYYDSIGGIGIEDLYFRGGKDENNKFKPDRETIEVLQRDFVDQGIPVYVVDYITGDKRIAKFEARAIADGFIPYASPDRDLNHMAAPLASTADADFML